MNGSHKTQRRLAQVVGNAEMLDEQEEDLLPTKITPTTAPAPALQLSPTAKGEGRRSRPLPGADLSTPKFLFYVFLAVVSHLGAGIDVGLMRYLQITSGLESIMVAGLGGFVNTLILLPWISFSFGYKKMWKMDHRFIYFLIVTSCNMTVIFALRFVYAEYVQIILLCTPFAIALLSRLLLKEQLPRYIVPAIVVSTLGAVLAMFGDFLSDDFESTSLTLENWIGLLLSVGGVLALAAQYVFVSTQGKDVSSEVIVFLTMVFSSAVLPISIFVEDWSIWTRMEWHDIATFFFWSVLTYLGMQLLMIVSIRNIGAPFVSVLLPLRLVSVLALGATPLLDEPLGILNIIGSVVIIVSLAVYLGVQYFLKKKQDTQADSRTS